MRDNPEFKVEFETRARYRDSALEVETLLNGTVQEVVRVQEDVLRTAAVDALRLLGYKVYPPARADDPREPIEEAAREAAREAYSHAVIRDRYDADLMSAGFHDGASWAVNRVTVGMIADAVNRAENSTSTGSMPRRHRIIAEAIRDLLTGVER